MPPSPKCKRGDVVLVLFPNSDLRTAKPRPALVVQADNLTTILESALNRVISSLPIIHTVCHNPRSTC